MTFDSREKSQRDGAPVECYRISLGATVYLWTSDTADVVLSTGTYTPMGISRGEIEFSNENGSGNLEVNLPLGNAAAAPFMAYMPGTPMALQVYRAHRGEESLARPIFFGTFVSIVTKEDHVMLTFADFTQVLRRKIPVPTYQPICGWALYGPGCKADRASKTDTVTLDAVAGTLVTSSSFASRPTNWYRNGFLTTAAGDVVFIVASSGSTVTLMNAVPGLAAGQTAYAAAGCDRLPPTCQNKFGNLVNFMGFPQVPTQNPFVGTVA